MADVETLTPILRAPTGDPMAWRGSDISSKDELAFDLSPRNVTALESILARVADLPRDDITREHCGHPDLDADLARIYEEVIRGRGLAIVRGFPVGAHAIEDVERMYWAFCTHFGNLLSNTSLGARMVRVQEELLPDGVQSARGTKSRAELAMHNDAGDLLMLLWVHQALEGGNSQFSSGPAAHDEILATRPDVLPILYRGFPQHRRSEQRDDQPAVTPYDVPIFANVDGRITINFTYSSILPALHELGRVPTPEEAEALDVLRAVLVRQQLDVHFEPGEIVVGNNFAMCHARSDFVNGERPEEQRLVLRAWTEVPPADRRLPMGRDFYVMENEGGRLGYDPVPGREGRIAGNDYNDVSPELAELFKAAQVKPRVEPDQPGSDPRR